MESTQITPHPSRPDAAMLAFNERYQAEKFLNHGSDIPHLGKVELSWMANPAPSTPVVSAQPETSKDVNMDEPQDLGQRPQAAEMDYDVADDDDNWLVD
jgi:hypothetical protein